MNVFKALGDTIHLIGIYLLIFTIFKLQSCKGISGKTQFLLIIAFAARYTQWVEGFIMMYIGLTFLILYLIYFKFKNTYDEEDDDFCMWWILLPAGPLVLGFLYMFIIPAKTELDIVSEIFWMFSLYFEALAILPQYYMFRKSPDTGIIIFPYIKALYIYTCLNIAELLYSYMYYSEKEDCATIFEIISKFIHFTILFVMIVDIKMHKEKIPKWQEITKVFVIETSNIDSEKKANLFGKFTLPSLEIVKEFKEKQQDEEKVVLV